MKRRARAAGRIALGVAAVAFLAVAFQSSLDDVQELRLPTAPQLLAAIALLLAGLACSARGWARLFDTPNQNELMKGVLIAQTMKYMPGAIWQPAKQVLSARRAGVDVPSASSAFLVHMLVQLAAACTVGSLLALYVTVPGFLRLLAGLSLLSVLTLSRPWMTLPLNLIQKITRRRLSTDSIPNQRAILSSYLWTLITQITHAGAFAIVAQGVGNGPWQVHLSAFSFAWAAGFAAVPFPSGLGVREAVLAAAIPGPAATVIAASAIQRLGTIAAEGAAAGLALLLLRSGRAKRDDDTTRSGDSQP